MTCALGVHKRSRKIKSMTIHQSFQKLSYSIGLNGTIRNHKVHLTTGHFRRYHINLESSTRNINKGCVQAEDGIFCDVRYRTYFGVMYEYAMTVLTTAISSPKSTRIVCDV